MRTLRDTTAMDKIGRRASTAVIAALMLGASFAVVTATPAAAAVTAVRGGALGYYTDVGLFGGPQMRRGEGQFLCTVNNPPTPPGCVSPASAPASASPSVVLPDPNGSAVPITAHDPDGAVGQYGPARIFAGKWPLHIATAPPSGPITTTTQGTPAGGSVTSSVDIVLRTPPNPDSPGGFGPGPVEGDELHSTCTATEAGTTGGVTFVNGILSTSTDPDGSPIHQEPIPNNPPPNYTRAGIITNVGDVFSVVFNEQIVKPDGSLVVNAVHMYLMGPVAVGEMVIGQVRCGTTPSALSPVDTRPPSCGLPVVIVQGPDNPTPVDPQKKMIGTFDTGGIASVTVVQQTNVTVQIGTDPSSAHSYLKFVPGQTGPLVMIGTRTNQSLPALWAFDVTDMAGNTTRCKVTNSAVPADFDGGRNTDISVFRPSTGTWFVQGGPTAIWGGPGDIAVPADYNGNGAVDVAVFRPSNGVWYIQDGATGGWGASGDIPVPGDYTGNGTADKAVFRPSTGVWYVQGGPTVAWGASGDIPVPGDYDGNGITDIAIFRPSTGVWYVQGGAITAWGGSGDIPVPGDYTGDGITDRAVFRPSTGVWYVQGGPTIAWGASGDIPVPGDYDGNGTSDIAVFRPSTGVWYIQTGAIVAWGGGSDIPLPLPAAIRQVFFP